MSNNRRFFTEERAVTPVIGIILIVAIAVVLGAVVSTYALGTANDVGSPAPQASFDFTVDDATGDIVVTKNGGDTINGDQLKFSGSALEKNAYGNITEWAGKDVQAGDSATVNVVAGESLEIIWQSPESDESAKLTEYDVPDDVGPTASIGDVNAYYTNDIVDVNNIQFTRAERVFVVVDDEEGDVGLDGDGPAIGQYVSTSGNNLDVNFGSNYIGRDEIITATVYETDSKRNQLATAQDTG